MVVYWFGIAFGLAIIITMLVLLIKTPSFKPAIPKCCRRCGYETYGYECPRCKREGRGEQNIYYHK